jgi:FkbM family methyltransferase
MSNALAVARALAALHNGICVPEYEKLLTQAYHRFLWRIPSQDIVIVDVGAHAGLHVEHFARFARSQGKVIAFEPLPNFARDLKARFAQPNVEIREIALGREAGVAQFQRNRDILGESGLRQRRSHVPVAFETVAVVLDTLDRQLAGLDRFSYVKIDVEGGEIDCLVGGRKTIMRLRPFVSVEYGAPGYSVYGHTAATLFALALDLNYVISDLFGNVIEAEADWLKICDAAYWDYFLIPSERIGEWKGYFA